MKTMILLPSWGKEELGFAQGLSGITKPFTQEEG
jgi:hypothetical protein